MNVFSNRMQRRALCTFASVALLATAAAPAIASGPAGVYAGSSPPAARSMKIALDVLRGGSRAKWDVGVAAPCWTDVGISNELGTDQAPYRPLRIHNGRFRQSQHFAFGNPSNYTLAGHAVPGGFVGTFVFRVFVSYANRWCTTTVLHWKARHSSKPFALALR